MPQLTDIEIAQNSQMLEIGDIAALAGIPEEALERYGRHKAKIDLSLLDGEAEDGKLILVTAITPTPAGEGKTTTTIGLSDALSRLGKKTVVALREPSLGPVFGVKGGAAGGGYAQVMPMEDINLHFTGDFHAIGAANNLLAAMIDNHIFQGNELGIDPRKITWRRCVDMNDRQLRSVVDGLGGRTDGVPREDGYDITVASEIMAVLCLARDLKDLKERLSRMVIGYTYGKLTEHKPVTAGDLKAAGAMCALLKDALKPNLVQTLEHTPAIVHGGPFANIAHGCNSVVATKMALRLGDYAVTEAGFGADLGAEKFLDIKCRLAGLVPSAVVVVATVRALKMHGGLAKTELDREDLEALEKGLPNLLQHVGNIRNVYHLPCVVAINAFPTDTKAELDLVEARCRELGVNVALSEVWAKGGEGGEALAREVLRLCKDPVRECNVYKQMLKDVAAVMHGNDEASRFCEGFSKEVFRLGGDQEEQCKSCAAFVENNKDILEQPESPFTYAYEASMSLREKIEAIAKKIYHARGVVFTDDAKKDLAQLERQGFGSLPICVAKTQYSFSDNPKLLGAPKNFDITVRKLRLSAGAGFVVALTGAILTMPGLPKRPAAESIDVDEKGRITGLF